MQRGKAAEKSKVDSAKRRIVRHHAHAIQTSEKQKRGAKCASYVFTLCHTAEWYSRDVRALFAHILWVLFAHILRVPRGGGDTDAEPSNLSGRQPYMYTASPGFRREGRQRPGVRRISPSYYLSASFMERFNLPFSSVPRNLTLTVSPTFTTSSTFSVRCC